MKTLTLLLVLMSLTTLAFASKASWEDIGDWTWRTKVPHGWLVKCNEGGFQAGTSMTFVPDENHEWRVDQ